MNEWINKIRPQYCLWHRINKLILTRECTNFKSALILETCFWRFISYRHFFWWFLIFNSILVKIPWWCSVEPSHWWQLCGMPFYGTDLPPPPRSAQQRAHSLRQPIPPVEGKRIKLGGGGEKPQEWKLIEQIWKLPHNRATSKEGFWKAHFVEVFKWTNSGCTSAFVRLSAATEILPKPNKWLDGTRCVFEKYK